MGKGLIQVVAGAHIKYVDNIPFILLGLKPSGIWEFPGGKVNNDESHSQAMEREWIEELGVMVECDEERFGHAEMEYMRYGSMRWISSKTNIKTVSQCPKSMLM